MPRLVITDNALDGLERCRCFLQEKNPLASQKAAASINNAFNLLEQKPEIGRPLSIDPNLRELIIPFGDSGYVSLYRYDRDSHAIVVLAFRHQKEAGY